MAAERRSALLPLACSLDASDGSRRMQEWRELSARAGRGRSVSPGRVRLLFADAPDVESELTRLVEAERQCCAFLGWHVDRVGEDLAVHITGTDDALASLPLD